VKFRTVPGAIFCTTKGCFLPTRERRDVPHDVKAYVPDIEEITTQYVTKVTSDALVEEFGDTPHARKKLAEKTGGSLDNAKDLLRGRHACQLATFFRLCRQVPPLKAAALRLMDARANLDPEFDRDMAMLFQQWQRMREGGRNE
jgi:hypothetical protein